MNRDHSPCQPDRYRFHPSRTDKPWGAEVLWAHTDVYVGKLLEVRAGHALSLQYHCVKDESWLVQSGDAHLDIGERDGPLRRLVLKAGDAFRLRPGTVHRLSAVSDTVVVELSTTELDDVVRLADDYGRAEPGDADADAVL